MANDFIHPIQTTIPEKLEGDSELATAALKELQYFLDRADTPPDKSTLDPNLRRAESHLKYLVERLEEDNTDTFHICVTCGTLKNEDLFDDGDCTCKDCYNKNKSSTIWRKNPDGDGFILVE